MRGSLPTLLCVGIPGAGKTVLASIAIEYLQSPERSKKLRVAYFFCNYQRQEEQKTQDILAALLRQLVEQQDQIPEDVHKLYQSYKSSRPCSDELSKILSIIGNHDRVYLIVDALDECSEEVRKRVCEKIQSLQDISKASFMATSRPIDAMNKEFPPNSRFEIRAQAEDVEMYLETELKYLPECISNSPDMQRDVKKCIADGIDGM
jgi:Cdc6-like AAA superfamily ATPase